MILKFFINFFRGSKQGEVSTKCMKCAVGTVSISVRGLFERRIYYTSHNVTYRTLREEKAERRNINPLQQLGTHLLALHFLKNERV